MEEKGGLGRNMVWWIGGCTYLALLILSVLLYKERTIFGDISYHLFCIVNEGEYAIQNYRVGAVVTQVFPVTASRLQLPLNQVAMIYSACFFVWFAAMFFVILKWLKNAPLALALLLFNTMMVTHTFYWIQSEMSQGMAFMFFHFALLLYISKLVRVPWYLWVLAFASTGFVIFFHPLSLFAFLFMIAFFALSDMPRWRFFAAALGCYVLVYALKYFLLPTPYESTSMGGLKNFVTRFPNYFTIQSNKNLVRYFISDYYFVPVVLVAVVAWYIRLKQWLKAALVMAFFVGYVLLVNVSYADGADQFYIENQYLVFSVFVIIPFVFDLLPAIRKPRVAVGIIACMVLAALLRIWDAHDVYTNRLNWNRAFMAKTVLLPAKKLIVPAQYAPLDTLIFTWASPYEFWLQSTIEQGETRSVIIEQQAGQFDKDMGCTNCLISTWWSTGYEGLNPRYFVMKDTTAYAKYAGQ